MYFSEIKVYRVCFTDIQIRLKIASGRILYMRVILKVFELDKNTDKFTSAVF